jgi:hypothetical protein
MVQRKKYIAAKINFKQLRRRRRGSVLNFRIAGQSKSKEIVKFIT